MRALRLVRGFVIRRIWVDAFIDWRRKGVINVIRKSLARLGNLCTAVDCEARSAHGTAV